MIETVRFRHRKTPAWRLSSLSCSPPESLWLLVDDREQHAMRMELAAAIRARYEAAASKDKRRILDEFIAAIGYHEKSAIRVLNNPRELKRCATRQRPSLYDEAVRGILIVSYGRPPIAFAGNALGRCCPFCCLRWSATDICGSRPKCGPRFCR